jgi:AcrR family transcriptional regulator
MDTGTVAWRERRRELRRARVVRSMAALASEHGFVGVSLAALCTDAGVARELLRAVR